MGRSRSKSRSQCEASNAKLPYFIPFIRPFRSYLFLFLVLLNDLICWRLQEPKQIAKKNTCQSAMRGVGPLSTTDSVFASHPVAPGSNFGVPEDSILTDINSLDVAEVNQQHCTA